MSKPTEEQQQAADQVALALTEVLDDYSGMWPRGVALIAAALSEAEARGRAQGRAEGEALRARIKKLAKAYERLGEDEELHARAADAFHDAALHLRRALADTEEA